MHLKVPILSIVVHRGKVWLSELAVVWMLAVYVCCLISLSFAVLFNESRITSNNRKTAELKTSRIVLQHRLETLREKHSISTTLREFTRGRLPESTLFLLTDLVHRNSKTYGYDPFLVLAVIHVESFFDTAALGRYRSGKFSGAFGLMQLKIATAREVAADLGIPVLRREDLFIPEINIALGTAYLTRQIAYFKSLKLGILAYNQGPGVIRQSLSGKRKLSIRYYNKVLKSYYRLKEMAADLDH